MNLGEDDITAFLCDWTKFDEKTGTIFFNLDIKRGLFWKVQVLQFTPTPLCKICAAPKNKPSIFIRIQI